MASQNGSGVRQGYKRPKLKYFFLNGELHRKLFVDRGRDTIQAWNYPQGKTMTYVYTDVLRRKERAFTTTEVCKLVNRSKVTVENALINDAIEKPQFTYGLNEQRKLFQYMWRKEDVMALHEYLASLHRGRPRKDGKTANNNLPTPRELRAMMNEEEPLYVRQGDEFIPTWRVKEF